MAGAGLGVSGCECVLRQVEKSGGNLWGFSAEESGGYLCHH